jgi:hypothetical protein
MPVLMLAMRAALQEATWLARKPGSWSVVSKALIWADVNAASWAVLRAFSWAVPKAATWLVVIAARFRVVKAWICRLFKPGKASAAMARTWVVVNAATCALVNEAMSDDEKLDKSVVATTVTPPEPMVMSGRFRLENPKFRLMAKICLYRVVCRKIADVVRPVLRESDAHRQTKDLGLF